MTTWLSILIPSAIFGLMCSYYLNGRLGIVCAAAVPWFGLLVLLLYQEYFVPYHGGGASMWPIAQLFAGTAAAFAGVAMFFLGKQMFIRMQKIKKDNRET